MTKSNAKFTSDIITHRSSRYSHARLTNIRYNNSILNVKVPHFLKYAKTRTWFFYRRSRTTPLRQTAYSGRRDH